MRFAPSETNIHISHVAPNANPTTPIQRTHSVIGYARPSEPVWMPDPKGRRAKSRQAPHPDADHRRQAFLRTIEFIACASRSNAMVGPYCDKGKAEDDYDKAYRRRHGLNDSYLRLPRQAIFSTLRA